MEIIVAQNKRAICLCHKKQIYYRLIEKFYPKQRGILVLPSGESDQFSAFLHNLIFTTSPSERAL